MTFETDKDYIFKIFGIRPIIILVYKARLLSSESQVVDKILVKWWEDLLKGGYPD